MIFEETIVLSEPFDQALERVKAAFAEQGFGTLTEIDMKATLQAKIGKEIDDYVIVGACNPNLAAQALDAVPQIGVLLPCNVVVRTSGSDVVVEAMDPGMMATLTGSDAVQEVATEARRLISNALEELASGS